MSDQTPSTPDIPDNNPTQPYPEAASWNQTQPLAPTSPPPVPTTPAHEAAGGYTAPAWGATQQLAPSQWTAAPTDNAEPEEHGKVGAGKIVAILAAAAIIGGAAGLGGAAIGSAVLPGASPVSISSNPSTVTVNDTESVNQITGIATKTLPSVVTISASTDTAGGTGSGVVLSADGYVVTNTHVVTLDGETGDATLSVTTSDGRVYDATVVGTDPTYDLAVIQLEGAEDLTPIEFADSDALNVGDETVAVGAPLGLSNTVTTGIVSALNRSIQIASSAAPENGDTETEDDTPSEDEGPFQFDFGQGQPQTGATGTISISVIQTDAAINPGNSGGALVDDQGRLIGINVAIASAGGTSDTAGSIGVGFSIPSNIVERVTSEIIDTGSASHGLLGAQVGDAAAQADATVAGAFVSEVTPGGAADTAGLQAGDVVTQFDGRPISDATDLTAQVRALAAGAETNLVYVRDGETFTVDVTLGELTQ